MPAGRKDVIRRPPPPESLQPALQRFCLPAGVYPTPAGCPAFRDALSCGAVLRKYRCHPLPLHAVPQAPRRDAPQSRPIPQSGTAGAEKVLQDQAVCCILKLVLANHSAPYRQKGIRNFHPGGPCRTAHMDALRRSRTQASARQRCRRGLIPHCKSSGIPEQV